MTAPRRSRTRRGAAARAPVSRTGATGFIPPPPGSLRFPEGRAPQTVVLGLFLSTPPHSSRSRLPNARRPPGGRSPCATPLRDAMAGGSLPRHPTQRRRASWAARVGSGIERRRSSGRTGQARRRRAAPRPAAGASSELPAQPPTAEAREKENEAWGRRSARGESAARPADRLPKRLRDPVQRKRAGNRATAARPSSVFRSRRERSNPYSGATRREPRRRHVACPR